MNQHKEKVSSASSAVLDPEDHAALDRANGVNVGDSAIQGAASPSPGVDGGIPPSTPTQQSSIFAGHVATLCNEFFVRRFGADKSLSSGLLEAIKLDVATALDTYFPNVQAKPGIFSALVLIGHYAACARQASIETRSASSAKAEPEKPPSLNGSLPESGG